MAKVSVKQLAKLEASLKEAIRVWTALDAKASKSLASKTRNGLAIATATEAFDSVRGLMIRYVQVLVTGGDGKHPSTPRDVSERLRGLPLVTSAAIRNLFDDAFDKPYAAVFANAGSR